jgi:FkbM family methyltransferase
MNLRRLIGRLTGTHIFRRLPRGIELAGDLRRWLPGFDPRIVFDVGAHHGQSATGFLATFPRATIYCFEPVERSFAELSRRIEGNARLRPVRLALGSSAGETTIRLEVDSDRNAVLSEAEPAGQTERVPMDTVDRFAERNGLARVGFLKIDTEGHDLAVLEGAEGLLQRGAVDLVQVESGWNPENRWHVPMERLKQHLEARGYRVFGVYQQKDEWPTGAPHLRRADLVFVSPTLSRPPGPLPPDRLSAPNPGT